MIQVKQGLTIRSINLERIGTGYTIRYWINNDKDYSSIHDSAFKDSLSSALDFISELHSEVRAEVLTLEATNKEVL